MVLNNIKYIKNELIAAEKMNFKLGDHKSVKIVKVTICKYFRRQVELILHIYN
jgi:hypothetical protein